MHRAAALLLATTVGSLLAVGSLSAVSAEGAPSASMPAIGAGRCPSASGPEVVLDVPLPADTKGRSIAVGGRAVWIASGSRRLNGRGALLRVDVGTGRVRRFALAGDPWSIAYGFGSLWLTGAGGGFDGAVVRVDPSSGRTVGVIRGPRRFGSALAITSSGVWIGGGDIFPEGKPEETVARWVFKIDPARNAVARSVRLGATTVIALAGQGDSLWATGWGAVVKLSAAGRVVFQQRFDGAGWSIAPVPGGAWVARPFLGTRSSRQALRARHLLRVRTSAPRPMLVTLAGQPGPLVVAGSAAWTIAGDWDVGRRELVRVEDSGAMTSVMLRGAPGLLAASGDSVWVARQQPHALSRVC